MTNEEIKVNITNLQEIKLTIEKERNVHQNIVNEKNTIIELIENQIVDLETELKAV